MTADADPPAWLGPTVWSLWHFQSQGEMWWNDEDEEPHLLLGFFTRRDRAEAVRARLRHAPGLWRWPNGWRLWREAVDGEGGWEQGFFNYATGDDEGPSADPADRLCLPVPETVPAWLWWVVHFHRR
jgi:hypothetical protein